MFVPSRERRDGYSLLEVLAVFAVLIILGAAVIPSLSGLTGDTNVKGAADLCVARLADARGYAIEEGRAYRFAVSSDGKKIRITPDELDSSGQPLVAPDVAPHTVDTDLPKDVQLAPDQEQRDTGDGWIRLVTFLPDGTCRERAPDFKLSEPGSVSFIVQVRGLTGAVTVNKTPVGNTGGK